MFCVCGRELTSTSATPWTFCTIIGGRVMSGICVHGKTFASVEIVSARNPFATYKEYLDHMKEITPKENQI